MEKIARVTTTFSSLEDAQDAAQKVLTKRLAACVQLSDKIQSFYWWKDAIEQDDEYLLTLKTRFSLYQKLEEYLKVIHPYDTPEILCEIIDHTESEYLGWLIEETTQPVNNE